METVTGKNLTGIIYISDNDIRIDLFSYKEFFSLEEGCSLYVITERGDTVSLHDNVANSSGRTQATFFQRILGNCAVIGHDRWTDVDMVAKVTFSVTESMEVLWNNEKCEALTRGSVCAQGDDYLFSVTASGVNLKARYAASYGMQFLTPVDIQPILEINFDRPQSLREYVLTMSNYVSFFSFCVGKKLRPHSIRVDKISEEQIAQELRAGTYLGNFEVCYIWPEEKPDTYNIRSASPVVSWNDEELDALRLCVVAWMQRADVWQKSYILMNSSFSLSNEVTATRLINACRWLEEIPIARATSGLLDDEIDAIASAAKSKAEELGCAQALAGRIFNAIKWVKKESHDQRFSRLLEEIENKFGKGLLPEKTIYYLKKSIEYRGKCAHGHFNPEGDSDFGEFNKVICAVEVFCFLLTALDLPISRAGIERIHEHRLVRDYLWT